MTIFPPRDHPVGIQCHIYQAFNYAYGTTIGTRFDTQIGHKYSREKLKFSSGFIWQTQEIKAEGRGMVAGTTKACGAALLWQELSTPHLMRKISFFVFIASCCTPIFVWCGEFWFARDPVACFTVLGAVGCTTSATKQLSNSAILLSPYDV